jgi:hypothetical protein
MNEAMKMSFSLAVIVLLLGICRLGDFCGVWGRPWTDLKAAQKEKEQFESPPTLSPLSLFSYKIKEERGEIFLYLIAFRGCLWHLSQNIVNLARSPPFCGFVCQFVKCPKRKGASWAPRLYFIFRVMSPIGEQPPTH